MIILKNKQIEGHLALSPRPALKRSKTCGRDAKIR
jgi:hypothetical protein